MIILHGSSGSPFVSRVRMQLHAKELPHELRPAPLGTPEFLRMNPLGKMPVIDHDGLIVPESTVIAEYLEDAFPTPSLRGESPAERARVRLVARTIDLYCGGVTEILRAAADPSHTIDLTAKKADLNKGLDALEIFLADDGHAVGRGLTLADCALVPWFFYAGMLTKVGDDAITRRPKIARYHASLADLPLAQRVLAEMDEAYRAFMARWKAQQAAKTT